MYKINRQLSGLPGFLTVFVHYRYLNKNLKEGDQSSGDSGECEIKSSRTTRQSEREREKER